MRGVSAESLVGEPWEEGCSLLVIPGGRDLPFVQDLGGRACGRIRRWVEAGGGRVLGICAGAYFACSEVDFERGTPLEVCGARELNLCPAVARGTLYPGFAYGSEQGAHAASITLDGEWAREDHQVELMPTQLPLYYNGGCWFDLEGGSSSPSNPPSASLLSRHRVLARYADRDGRPAIIAVYRRDEQQPVAILSGVHVEYDAEEVARRQPDLPILSVLQASTQGRLRLWNSLLQTLGLLAARSKEEEPPKPTPIYLFSPEDSQRRSLLAAIRNSSDFDAQERIFGAERVRFPIIDGDSAAEALPRVSANCCPVVVMTKSGPEEDHQWTFSPSRYYKCLVERPPMRGVEVVGRHLLYAEYIDSTQTLLLQNSKLAALLPSGSILLAGDQLAGKGRGANTWLSSTGCLQFTMLLHHRDAETLTLIQYLTGLAMVEAILGEAGYEVGKSAGGDLFERLVREMCRICRSASSGPTIFTAGSPRPSRSGGA